MSQGEFVCCAQISLVLPPSHFAIAIPVRLAALFFLLARGEMSMLPGEVKGSAPGQPGKPGRGVRRELLLPAIGVVDEVVLPSAEALDHGAQSSGCHMDPSFLLGIFLIPLVHNMLSR